MSAPKCPTPEKIDGALLLDEVERFVSRFVAYPSEHARVAHVLWIAHTWRMSDWDSTPRIAFMSPEPGSGKSRALEVTEPLVPRPVHAVNVSSAYLFRKVADEAGAPTILFDEIDTIFGPRAKENEELRGLLNAGHRKGAMAGRCEMQGKTVITVDYPAYCAVALAGLDDLPDTIRTRSIIVRMRRRAPGEKVEPWRARINAPQGHVLAALLMRWSAQQPELTTWPEMPPGVEDRNADVWEALLATAERAGGEWPARARAAAVAMTKANADQRQTLGVQLLTDLRTVFDGYPEQGALPTVTILERLVELEESPWSDMRGKPIDARKLANMLRKYDIRPGAHRIGYGGGSSVTKGYARTDLHDAWKRYLPPVPEVGNTGYSSNVPSQPTDESAAIGNTSVTASVTAPDPEPGCNRVTAVTDKSQRTQTCRWQDCSNGNCQAFKACVKA